MCVVALALNQHPDWPIIMVGNRDEFHGRASVPLHLWDDASGIVAGRDLVGGGTWLGVHPALGRLVVVTNARGEGGPDPDKYSRGALVRDLLTGDGAFATPEAAMLDDFNGFNLFVLQPGRAQLMTNRPAPATDRLAPGVHALANAQASEGCERSRGLSGRIGAWLAAGGGDPAGLLDMMTDTAEPALFLNHGVYGTRCSTLVAIDRAGRGQMTERRFGPGGAATGETVLSFNWSGDLAIGIPE